MEEQPRREVGKSEVGSRRSEVIFNSEFRILNSEFKKVCAAVREGHSVLVLGETGMGTGELAQALYEEMLGDFQCAIATYKGSLKKFFTAIAFQLQIPTEDDNDKSLTVDAHEIMRTLQSLKEIWSEKEFVRVWLRLKRREKG